MKFAFLCLFNIILLPFHALFFSIAIVMTFLPLFPTRVGMKNLRSKLGVSRVRAQYLLACVFFQYYLYILELLVIWPLGLLQQQNTPEFDSFLVSMRKKYQLNGKRGILMAGGHFCNIEGLGKSMRDAHEKQGCKHFYVLAQPSGSKIIQFLMDSFRRANRFHVLWTKNKDLLRTMAKKVSEGHGLALLLDQKPSTGGMFLEFFGEFAAFPKKGIEVGVKAEMPVVYLAAQRILPGYFRLHFAEGFNSHLIPGISVTDLEGNSRVQLNRIFEPSAVDFERHSQAVMAGFVGWLELLVRQQPAQWFWDYKKWSRTPQLSASQQPKLPEVAFILPQATDASTVHLGTEKTAS
jgi:lauroyl/myristoyl acyltransferase